MALEFQIDSKVCYAPLKGKCEAIRNLESAKTLKQTRAFCGMVHFLSSFLPNLCGLLISIYDLQRQSKKFKWTQEAETASGEGVRGTLFQKQGDEWVVIGYHSRSFSKNFGVTSQ